MFSEQQLVGANWILEHALEARGERTLVICDEFTTRAAECIRHVGDTALHAPTTVASVPSAEQRHATPNHAPSSQLRKLIDASPRVIVLQRMDHTTVTFRMNVLRYCQNDLSRRAASMPGVTEEFLHLCGGDLDAIARQCDLIAATMLRAKHATITTRSDTGEFHELRLGLGQHKPIMSTGKIARRDWGNVPSGETFLVPNDGAATGSIAIDGSILNYPMPPGEELVCHVAGGIVRSVDVRGEALRSRAEEILLKRDGTESCEYASWIAELGIGANESIRTFTGLPIFDEKIAGTAHLGMGGNTQFGGSIPAGTHMDYVARRPTVVIGDAVVVKDGRLIVSNETAYPNWRTVKHPERYEHYNRGVQLHELVPGTLGAEAWVVWEAPRSGARCRTRIGDDETARMAAAILPLVRDRPVPIGQLVKALSGEYDEVALTATLSLLEGFGVVAGS